MNDISKNVLVVSMFFYVVSVFGMDKRSSMVQNGSSFFSQLDVPLKSNFTRPDKIKFQSAYVRSTSLATDKSGGQSTLQYVKEDNGTVRVEILIHQNWKDKGLNDIVLKEEEVFSLKEVIEKADQDNQGDVFVSFPLLSNDYVNISANKGEFLKYVTSSETCDFSQNQRGSWPSLVSCQDQTNGTDCSLLWKEAQLSDKTFEKTDGVTVFADQKIQFSLSQNSSTTGSFFKVNSFSVSSSNIIFFSKENTTTDFVETIELSTDCLQKICNLIKDCQEDSKLITCTIPNEGSFDIFFSKEILQLLLIESKILATSDMSVNNNFLTPSLKHTLIKTAFFSAMVCGLIYAVKNKMVPTDWLTNLLSGLSGMIRSTKNGFSS